MNTPIQVFDGDGVEPPRCAVLNVRKVIEKRNASRVKLLLHPIDVSAEWKNTFWQYIRQFHCTWYDELTIRSMEKTNGVTIRTFQRAMIVGMHHSADGVTVAIIHNGQKPGSPVDAMTAVHTTVHRIKP